MKIGVPFNPYRVFQGAFAPFWLLEHRGLGAGAKLCYIRLLGFAGRDGRCYPSVETLGNSLGVSDRQARDYVKELERAGLIVIEQRGLRKTNVYLFVWTAELERLINSVPETPHEPDDENGPISRNTQPDRNSSSVPDRNSTSAPDRNSCSAQDRNTSSGPIGINSLGIGSLESSSSSAAGEATPATPKRKTTKLRGPSILPELATTGREEYCRKAKIILSWARVRGIQRLRSNRIIGLPEDDLLQRWAAILDRAGIQDKDVIVAVLDAARDAADRAGDWRNWSFLTLQIQFAAERTHIRQPASVTACGPSGVEMKEDQTCVWAQVKNKIRTQVGEIPFMNWFHRTLQTDCRDAEITIVVPDELTRTFLENEYRELIGSAVAGFGIQTVLFVLKDSVQ